jgi:hypothetical protein
MNRLALMVFALAAVAVINPAKAQTTDTSTSVPHATIGSQIVGDDVQGNIQAPWNSVNNSVMALRAPGRLVTAARTDFNNRHSSTVVQSRFGPNIDAEPSTTPSIGKQVKVEVLTTLFTNFNAALNAWLTLIGLPTTPGTDTTSGLDDLLGIITRPV